jgi:hypothetical protein
MPRRRLEKHRLAEVEAMMMDQEQHGDFAPVYRRELPGGGYVAIDVQRRPAEKKICRSRVSVERRSADERRAGHRPVVIAEVDGDERSPAFTELYKIAADNSAIARALLRIEGPAD